METPPKPPARVSLDRPGYGLDEWEATAWHCPVCGRRRIWTECESDVWSTTDGDEGYRQRACLACGATFLSTDPDIRGQHSIVEEIRKALAADDRRSRVRPAGESPSADETNEDA
jgi:hypothetical protein